MEKTYDDFYAQWYAFKYKIYLISIPDDYDVMEEINIRGFKIETDNNSIHEELGIK